MIHSFGMAHYPTKGTLRNFWARETIILGHKSDGRRRMSRSDRGMWKLLCFKVGYEEPTWAQIRGGARITGVNNCQIRQNVQTFDVSLLIIRESFIGSKCWAHGSVNLKKNVLKHQVLSQQESQAWRPGRNNGQNFSGIRALTAVKISHRSRY